MNKTIAAFSIVFVMLIAWATCALAQDVHVRGYQRQDGTYVQEHMRSAPNNTANDNWSTKGNTNPYTGQEGTKSPTPSYHQPSSNPYGTTNPYGASPYGKRGF